MIAQEELTGAMKLYLLRGDLDIHWLRSADDSSWHWRGGVPVNFPWREPSLTLSAEGEEFVPVDCLAMNTGCDGPILSNYARRVLEELMRPEGEFWPVNVLGYQYWWFNCLSCVDALDQARTDADWERVDGDWGEFRWITTPRRLAFRAASVGTHSVFRVPEFPQGILFGGDALARAVAKHGLTGFRLDLVWSSTDGGVQDPAGFGFGEVFDARAPEEAARKRAQAAEALRERGRGHAREDR